MSKQPEIPLDSKLKIDPMAGLLEPRMWVRRLVILEKPGGDVIRDVSMRPGLNIVWSPDGSDNISNAGEDIAMGHGAGKTLFCRLIRYCLGEGYPADEEQRDLISSTLINSVVCAEVVLDGTCWSIVRPLGAGLKDAIVIKGVPIDEVAIDNEYITGMKSFLDAVEEAFNAEKTRPLMDISPSAAVWLVALAWLARDQDCRFHHVLDWRDSESGSRSPHPANSDTKFPRLEALRAFIGAITLAEREASQAEKDVKTDIDRLLRDQGHLNWDIGRKTESLINDLGLQGEELSFMEGLEVPLAEKLRQLADIRMADALSLPSIEVGALEDARCKHFDAKEKLVNLKAEEKIRRADEELSNKDLARVKGELGKASVSKDNAEEPVCPICEVPVDRVLAEGCKLSHNLPDLESCRERYDRLVDDIDKLQGKISSLKTREGNLKYSIAAEEQNVERLKVVLDRLERSFDKKNQTLKKAETLLDRVSELSQILKEKDTFQQKTVNLEKEQAEKKGTVDKLRRLQAGNINQISAKLEPIISYIVSRKDSKSSVSLTGQELKINVNAGGNRRTAAIESLKVIAFDLACLCRSMEGKTNVPAFLIHDSPREADLGLPIYHQLFRLICILEEATQTPEPLFQYIITTTTKPPDDLCRKPWLVLELAGSPGIKRLLRQDL